MKCWNCDSELDTISAEDVSEGGGCSIFCPCGQKNLANLRDGTVLRPLPWWQNGLIFFGIAAGIVLTAYVKQRFFPGM